MNILSYLLSCTLIILTFTKSAELFIRADRQLKAQREQFITETRKKLFNRQGSISLVASLFTALLSLLLLFYVTKLKIEYQEALYRKESYVCFHYLNLQTERYIKEMAGFNWSLRAAFISNAKALLESLVLARNLRHWYYLKNFQLNRYCHAFEGAPYLKNLPLKTQPNLALATNIDQTSMMRVNNWTNYYRKTPRQIRLAKSFCLEAKFQMQNAFIPSLRSQLREIPLLDSANLKCLSGL